MKGCNLASWGRLGIAGLVLGSVSVVAEPGAEVQWAAGQFFQQQVLPILENRCFECHSHQAPSAKGGLYLDSRSGWEQGGNAGSAIVPGDPDASLLIQAVRSVDEDFQMPPKGERLTAAQVAVLEKWVRLGAYDPRVRKGPEDETDARSSHWAFQPVVTPELPEVARPDWVQTPVDAFILRRLEDQELAPSEPASRRTLIRRVYQDLIGLPPSVETVERFVEDRRPDAYRQLVDRLLASPAYGERWGRHWLDIARYADTKGYVFQEERRFPFSYTYRDYVIDAFNRDLPFDRFVQEQLAADHLELGDDPSPMAGMGFLTLGRRFLNNQTDIVDDRIDVVTRGLMGLTVACARCHDHKYDPIPTADYYSLYGVFASSQEPAERPLIAFDETTAAYRDFEKERKRRTEEWDTFRITSQKGGLAEARKRTGDYLLVLHDAAGINRSETENLVRSRKLGPVIAFRWQSKLKEPEVASDPVLGPWIRLTSQGNEGFAARFGQWLEAPAGTDVSANPLLVERLREAKPASIEALAAVYNELFVAVEEAETEGLDSESTGTEADWEAVRQVVFASGAPPNLPLDQATQLLDVRTQEKIRRLKRELDKLPATHPGAPPRAMALVDRGRLVDPVVFLRGKPGSRGPKVPRQFLEVLEGTDRKPFARGSGRLDLAEAITRPDNPLTSRVLVNRIWRQHFGVPLVATPSDFGVRADPPSHPELLDFLASRLVSDGWSLKGLHRLILLSATYQQSSAPDAYRAAVDPGNRWLWRMNRRRLELEPLRDTLLQVSGALDRNMGGQPVEITEAPFTPRRTVYGFVERQNLPSLFRTFDLASPDTSSPGRFETTVPQQALFMVNSPFVHDLSRRLEQAVNRSVETSGADPIRALWRRVLQRDPSRAEVAMAGEFLANQKPNVESASDTAVWSYGYGRYDAESDRVASFTAFASFSERSWRGGSSLPDPDLGWAQLTARGGHPGAKPNGMVIRRWVAPYAANFRISGQLEHSNEEGNGVRARLVSSAGGLVEAWDAADSSVATEPSVLTLGAGDRLDFVVDANGDINHDSYEWTVKIVADDSPLLSDQRYWDSKEDFSGPIKAVESLSPLARLGQVLLMSNELAFVD